MGLIEGAQRSFNLISPYFVPAGRGTGLLGGLVARGVATRVLTNALEATDVALVHAGYMKRRRALLAAGVRLFEMRRHSPKGDWKDIAGPFGISGASLHAKTFSVDGERVFVGSFNFDARSANLNTESGFLIDSPELARRIDEAFDTTVAETAYEVRLNGGALQWVEHDGGTPAVYRREPNTGFARWLVLRLLSCLPIEALL
ncbi:phospholipase D-like domain-containing protein [Arhodomonas aquaeolei]|nr:phospholipase D-like domain-containing protein [Arhodomonas aquaeolei]